MTTTDRYTKGIDAASLVLAAAEHGTDELRLAIDLIDDELSRRALAALAHMHASSTRGNARFVPDAGIAALALAAADEHGFAGAYELADAFSAHDVRAALGNLAWAMRRQSEQRTTAAAAAPLN